MLICLLLLWLCIVFYSILGNPFSSYCANAPLQLSAGYSTTATSTTWSLYNSTAGASAGIVMTTTSGTSCGGSATTVQIIFLCAPLQTHSTSFSSISNSGCTYTMTLYTSLACTTAQLASPPTAISPPPAATSTNCGYNGVSFASLAVDFNATDEAGRTYVVHPCGAVTSVSTQYCAYPSNAAQQPSVYVSVCEVTGYCNPFYAEDGFSYFQPSSSSFNWYPLSNGFAYSINTTYNYEGWYSQPSSGCTGGITSSTFTFICNASASTVALTASTARIYAAPTSCQYIVQLQTSLACQGSQYWLAAPQTSPQFGGLGYDLSSLTGYDIFASQSGTFNGQFAQFSFCINMYNGSTTNWAYSARGVMSVAYTLTSGTIISSPTGSLTINSFVSSVISSANGNPDVQLILSPLSTDGSDNLLVLTSGTDVPDGGGVTVQWTTPSSSLLEANLYISGSSKVIDTNFPAPNTWPAGATFTFNIQYYNPASPSLISCGTTSTPIPFTSTAAPSVPVPAYYYYLNLAGQVQDPTCQQYAPGSMICQRWGITTCSNTALAAIWQPSKITPSWTWINGMNYGAGIQLTLQSSPPTATALTGSTFEIGCVGQLVRIQFICSALSNRPYVAASLVSAGSFNFACVWTFTIATYLVCQPPSITPIPQPTTQTQTCVTTINGITYNFNPLQYQDLSAYLNGTQYLLRPCGFVQNAFCQGSQTAYQSQLCAIPQVCSNSVSGSISVTSITGLYNSSLATWSLISNGISLTQTSGQTCTATCGTNAYNGPWMSIINFMCSSATGVNLGSQTTVSVGSYNSTTCAVINGGPCTVIFTTYTSYACSTPNPGYVSFNALTTAAPWEARANMGYGITVSPITYTAVGSSSNTTLPVGSFIVYGGQNELPTNPNTGSGTYQAPEYDVWASTNGANWNLIGGYTLSYGSPLYSSIVGATSVQSVAAQNSLPGFIDGENSMKCTDKNTGQRHTLSYPT
jgi:hypothetical protein